MANIVFSENHNLKKDIYNILKFQLLQYQPETLFDLKERDTATYFLELPLLVFTNKTITFFT